MCFIAYLPHTLVHGGGKERSAERDRASTMRDAKCMVSGSEKMGCGLEGL
jgi:hypothetical protein